MPSNVKIEPGPELDRAVAEVAGDPYPRAHDWEYTGLSGHETSFYRCKNCGDLEAGDWEPGYCPDDPCVKPYSTDPNAAFMAAEEVGLFNQYAYCRASGQHVISKTVPVASWGDTIAHAPTPTLAICAAILKLKES